ncbi:MAG: flagellar basal body protein [Enterobacter hormaechei]
MSSLINSAMSGLSAAQSALNTVSNNISSYNVAGYTRQTTILGASNSTLTGGGWVGNGVYVSGVQREYDAFITNQVAWQNQSSGRPRATSRCRKLTTLSDTTNSLSANFQDFLKPANAGEQRRDPAARQTVLKADGLVNQFKTNDQYLRDRCAGQHGDFNSVDQINNYAKQIANPTIRFPG